MTGAEKGGNSPAPVGYCFLTFDSEGVLESQGQIVDAPQPGYYLCQFFDWAFGLPSVCKLVPASEMVGWKLYQGHDEWRRAADNLLPWGHR